MNEISRRIREFYFGDQPIGKETLKRFSDLYSDRFFVQGLFELAESHAKYAPVYPYVVTYKGGDSGVGVFGYELPSKKVLLNETNCFKLFLQQSVATDMKHNFYFN